MSGRTGNGWMRVGLALVFALAGSALAYAAASGSRAGEPRWTTLADSEIARTEVSAAALGRSVYVVGGFREGGAPTPEVERYDTVADRWQTVAPMPVSLNHAAAVAYGEQLYVAGGYTGAPFSLGLPTTGSAAASRELWRYDPGRDDWSRMPPAPTARGAAAAAVVGHELMVAGGGNELRPLPTFEVFDFRTGRWRTGPDLPIAAEHVAGVAAGGAFYVLGGRRAYGGGVYASAFRYRPGSGRWERLADMRRGRAGFGAAEACGDVVALGGEDPGSSPAGTIPEVERYEPDQDRWQALPDMPTPRHGLGVASVDDRILALEGGPVTFLSVSYASEALQLSCPAGVRPRLGLRVLDRRLAPVRRRGALRVRVRTWNAGRPVVRALARARGRRVARGRARVGSRARTVRLRLTPAGRRLVGRARRLRVQVNARARDSAGHGLRRSARRSLR